MSTIKTIRKVAAKGLRLTAERLDKTPEAPTVWKSTPSLSNVLETDGNGNFRNLITNKKVYLNHRKAEKALTLKLRINGKREVISLQKFVAMIYHPNNTGSTMTKVLDGNKRNLSKDNVVWVNSNRKY